MRKNFLKPFKSLNLDAERGANKKFLKAYREYDERNFLEGDKVMRQI